MARILSFFISILLIFSNLGTPGVGAEKPDVHKDSDLCTDYSEYISSNFISRRNAGIINKAGLRSWIIETLKKDAGYSDSQITLQSAKVAGITTGKNIVLTVKGKNPGKQIIAGAHYDGSGSGDNASGVALLLATAVELAGKELPYTVKYVFFDSEEIGLVGSGTFAKSMSEKEAASTVYMINIDCIAFGDYCCIYGGITQPDGSVTETSAYNYAMKTARSLGFNTYLTKQLDGYYAKNGKGPKADPKGFYTNPWTKENPAPLDSQVYSPATFYASDFVGFADRGIPYIYFEATNWFAQGKKLNSKSYTGYYESDNVNIGNGGMFMNTRFDTITNLEKYFPGRASEHFSLYYPLLRSLILKPM